MNAEQPRKRHRRLAKMKPEKKIPPSREVPAEQVKKVQSRIEREEERELTQTAPPKLEEVQPLKEVEVMEKFPVIVGESVVQERFLSFSLLSIRFAAISLIFVSIECCDRCTFCDLNDRIAFNY
jgi:hypothetical protein